MAALHLGKTNSQVLLYLCVAAAIASVVSTSAATTTKTDKERLGLNGPVQTMIEESGTQGEGDGWLNLETTLYDRIGNVIETEQTMGRKSSPEKSKTIYERSADGKSITRKTFGQDGSLLVKGLSLYDEKGNRIEDRNYDKEGSLLFKLLHVYDVDGNSVESKSYLRDGSLKSKSVSVYDGNGNMTSSSFTKCTSQQDCILEYKSMNTYDTKGILTEAMIYKADGELDHRSLYIHNAKGQQQQKTDYNADGSIREKESYYNEYDSVGNWIKRVTTKAVSKEGKLILEPLSIIKRNITYYGSPQIGVGK